MNVPEIVEAAGIGRLAGGKPRLARLPALPGPCSEAEDFHLDAAALQGARQDIGAGGRDRDRAPAHRAGIVQQQRHHGVAEGRFPFSLMTTADDRDQSPRATAAPDRARPLEIEFPGAVLLRHQPALQPVGEPRHDPLQMRQLLVEIAAQALQSSWSQRSSAAITSSNFGAKA